MKRLVLALCALAAMAGTTPLVQAQDQQGNAGANAPAERLQAAPDQLLRGALHRLGHFLAGGGTSPAAIRSFLEKEIAPYFDFDAMARWAAGALYYRLTPPQQERLTEKLQDMFLNALARNLGSYARPLPRVDVYPAHVPPWAQNVTVRSLVSPVNAYPIQLEFRFYRTPVGWKVYDVAANGVSAVAYYRSYFGDLLRRYGPAVALQ